MDVWGGSLCYILLDYLGEEVPSENDLKEIKPFYKECYINRHRMVKQVIDKLSVPGNYIYIGKIPLVVTNCRDGSYFNGSRELIIYLKSVGRLLAMKHKEIIKSILTVGNL